MDKTNRKKPTLRVIGGIRKGSKLLMPEHHSIRPTKDRIKECLFNILTHHYHQHWNDLVVGDFFAGSGNLGIEALSRGAFQCFFMEHNELAFSCIKKNIQRLSFGAQSVIINQNFYDSFLFPKPLDVIFCDPPYATYSIKKIMESLKRMKTLKNNTLLCLEDFYPYPFDEVQHFADDHISASLLDQRVFNKTGIYIYGFSC